MPQMDKATKDRQMEQMERFLEFQKQQGAIEGPVRLDTYFRPDQQARLRWLKENCIGRVLEVGCSWGFVLAFCGGHAGVDVSKQLIMLGKALAPERDLREGTALALPYGDQSFETVMLPEVLEHLDFYQVPSALMEALRVAQKRILITIPNGQLDTEHATSFKHHWLLDMQALELLLSFIPCGKRTIERVADFVCIRIDLEA